MPALLVWAFLVPLLIPIYHLYAQLSLLGFFTSSTALPSIRSSNPLIQEKFKINDIQASEDMAVHGPTGKIIFVGQQRMESRYGWFPPGGVCIDAAMSAVEKGQMWAVDPKDWTPVNLPILNYDGPFTTHGFGLYTPPGSEGDTTAYMHAVNHVPHRDVATRPDDSCGTDEHPAADSRIEIFKLDLDSSSPLFGATHIRTVKHDLIRTPNDVLSIGPGEFVISNDHRHRSGLLRDLEDMITWKRLAQGELIRVSAELEEGGAVEAEIILTGIHNANGLGPGMHPRESLAVDASGGMLHILEHSVYSADGKLHLRVNESVQLPNALDNPFALVDPFAIAASDISAYVLGGVLTGGELGPKWRDSSVRHPWSVHLVRRKRDGKGWDKLKILQDDGHFVNALSSALLVPIPPEKSEGGAGKREAWVVLTSFFAESVGVVRVDLTEWGRR